MEPQSREFFARQLKREIARKPAGMTLDGFVESFRLHPVQRRKIAIEQHRLVTYAENAQTREKWIIAVHGVLIQVSEKDQGVAC